MEKNKELQRGCSRVEIERNVKEDLKSIDVACEWFHTYFAKKAVALCIQKF